MPQMIHGSRRPPPAIAVCRSGSRSERTRSLSAAGGAPRLDSGVGPIEWGLLFACSFIVVALGGGWRSGHSDHSAIHWKQILMVWPAIYACRGRGVDSRETCLAHQGIAPTFPAR